MAYISNKDRDKEIKQPVLENKITTKYISNKDRDKGVSLTPKQQRTEQARSLLGDIKGQGIMRGVVGGTNIAIEKYNENLKRENAPKIFGEFGGTSSSTMTTTPTAVVEKKNKEIIDNIVKHPFDKPYWKGTLFKPLQLIDPKSPKLKADTGKGIKYKDLVKQGEEKLTHLFDFEKGKGFTNLAKATGDVLTKLSQTVPSIVRGFLGKSIYEKTVAPTIQKTLLKDKKEFIPKAGEIVGGLSAYYALSNVIGNAMAGSEVLKPLITKAPIISQGLQYATTRASLDQIQTNINSTLGERTKIVYNNLLKYFGWGVAGAVPIRQAEVWIPSVFAGDFISSKLKGQNNETAFKNATISTGIMSIFKIPEVIEDPYTIAKRQSAKILGIDKNASLDEAKKAFRELAHQTHPDVGGTAEGFKQVNEAYKIFKSSPVEFNHTIKQEIKDLYTFYTSPEGKGMGVDILRTMPKELNITDIAQPITDIDTSTQQVAPQPKAPPVYAEPPVIPAKAPITPPQEPVSFEEFVDTKTLTQKEMLKRGADGYLKNAIEIDIPINKIEGREPAPAVTKGFKKITQPIEVVYDDINDYYILYSGNHRVVQAEINKQKYISAFVEDKTNKTKAQLKEIYDKEHKPTQAMASEVDKLPTFSISEKVPDIVKEQGIDGQKPPTAKIKDTPIMSNDIQKEYEFIKDAWFSEKDWQAKKAEVETARFQDEIKSITGEKKFEDLSQDIDKAIQVYIDTKRNPENIKQYYDKLTTGQKKIVDLSQNLTDTQKAIADKIAKDYDKLGFEAMEAEVIRNVLDNYAGRIWDIKQTPTETFRKFGTTTRHAKQRKLDTIIEGWAKGLSLKVEGATNNLSILKEEISNTIQDKNFIKELQKMKDIEGNSILSTSKLDGYKQVEHPNFKVWRFAGETTPEDLRGRNFFQTAEGTILEKKDLYAPKKIANNLNNIMGVSKLKGIWAVDKITKYTNILKNWILQSSFFHHTAFGRSFYLGGKLNNLGDGMLDTLKNMTPRQAYKAGLENIKALTPEIELLVRNGLTLGKIQDWEEDLLRQEDTFIGNILDKSNATKITKDKINKFREQQADFLFNDFGQGLKTKMALTLLKDELKKFPTKNPNDIAKYVANLMNDDFGGLHLKRIGRDPTVQHIFRIFALAPDWTESNIRSFIKAAQPKSKIGQIIPKKIAEARGKEYEPISDAESKIYRRFWARIVSKGLLLTILANLALNGKDTIKNYKTAWQEGKLRWLDIDITNLYKLVGGDTSARKYISGFGHFKDPLKFAIDPIESAHYKGSVVYSTIYEAISGEDWAGRSFTSIEDLLKTKQTVKYAPFEKKAQKYTTLPSYILNQIKGIQPVQFQNLLEWWNGEMEGFDAITNSMGLGVRTTYPTKKKKEAKPPSFKTKSFNFKLPSTKIR